MHKYMRAIGFSTLNSSKKLRELLTDAVIHSDRRNITKNQNNVFLGEFCKDFAKGLGIAVCGEFDEEEKFFYEYYYPYLEGSGITSCEDISVERHAEKESYAGVCDDMKVGISLIFYLDNGFEYLERKLDNVSQKVKAVKLTGLSEEGKILLPLHKTRKQIEKAKVAAKDRTSLLEAARNGDEDAMETLTIEDIDMYSQISRRVMKEDIYSIVDSSFMPSGIECDHYTVIGEIIRVEEKVNRISSEVVYDLTLSCNDMVFHVGIAKRNLLGEPVIGRRFKGQIWMQGAAVFEE